MSAVDERERYIGVSQLLPALPASTTACRLAQAATAGSSLPAAMLASASSLSSGVGTAPGLEIAGAKSIARTQRARSMALCTPCAETILRPRAQRSVRRKERADWSASGISHQLHFRL